MFMKNLVISGLRKQHTLLDELISQLEEKPKLDGGDQYLYHQTTGKVAKNLKELRRIKGQYISYLNSEESDTSHALLETWMIRSGISPKSNLTVNQIGLYTDFT